jgi:hypothetical protein
MRNQVTAFVAFVALFFSTVGSGSLYLRSCHRSAMRDREHEIIWAQLKAIDKTARDAAAKSGSKVTVPDWVHFGVTKP